MLALRQVSISSLRSQTCPNKLNSTAADRATGINIYTSTHTRAHIDTLWHTDIKYMYMHKFSICDTGLVIFITQQTILRWVV